MKLRSLIITTDQPLPPLCSKHSTAEWDITAMKTYVSIYMLENKKEKPHEMNSQSEARAMNGH